MKSLLALLVAAFLVQPAMAETSRVKANIAIVRAFYEAGFNQKDLHDVLTGRGQTPLDERIQTAAG